MSATYNPALPTYRDWVRLLIGDTDATAPLVGDETINAMLTVTGFAGTIALLAESFAVEYAQHATKTGEHYGLTQEWTDRIATWKELATKARAGLLADPFAVNGQTPVVQTTSTQQATPGRPLPTMVPPGVMGGFRSE